MLPICHQGDRGMALLCRRNGYHILLFIICGRERLRNGVLTANITFFYYLQQERKETGNSCLYVFLAFKKGGGKG